MDRTRLSKPKADQRPARMVWYRGRWHKQRLFPRKLAYRVLAGSIICVLVGFAIWGFSPQERSWVSSGSCPNGGEYYSRISTSLCGVQYDVCVSFDYNCGNDYHPPQVERRSPVYGLEAAFLTLTGFLGMFVTLWLSNRSY